MGGFSDFLNETLPQEEGKKSAFLGFLDTFTKDEPTQKVEQKPAKTGFTSFLEETMPSSASAVNAAVQENLKTIPPPQTEEYVDYTAPKPKEPPLTIISHGIPTGEISRERAMKMGGGLTQFASGLVPGMKQAMGLLAPVPEPETAEERVMGGAGKFTGLLGAPSFVGGKVAGLATKGVAKVLGAKLAPTIAGEAIQLGVSRGVSLGTAGVLNDLGEIKSGKEALNTFKTYAIMGEIFGLAGMAHLPKHPVMSQIIRQVGGRVLLGDKLSKESFSPENIGQTTFNELLNTFFLAHGESPAKVFAGGIAHGKAVRFIEGMETKPTPAEVKAAGGPAKWLGKALTELTEAAKPVAELAKAEAPGVLYSREKPEEQLAIPGVTPPPERPELFAPEKPYAPDLKAGERPAQGVLPMPDAAPLFAGTETAKEPWQMTRDEYRKNEIYKKYLVINDALKSGHRVEVRTQMHVTPLSSPDHIRLTRSGEVQTMYGRGKWAYLTAPQVDSLATQAGMKIPEWSERVLHEDLVKQAQDAGKPVPPDVLAEYSDTLYSQEFDIHPEDRYQRDKDFGGRMAAAQAQAAERRGQGIPEAKKKKASAFTKAGEKEYYERQAVDEALAAIKEGATTYDALDPVYYPIFEKHLDAATLYDVSGGKAGQPKGRLVIPETPPARTVAGQTVTPPPLITGETGAEARFVPETAIPAPPARGIAPKTLPELQAEIVRINEGRVSTEQAAALGALVRGVARYKGLTPDAYVEGRFAGLEAGEAPPEKPFFGRESTAEYIRQLNARGITDPKMVEKILNGEPIASVEFLADGKAVIRAFRKSNIAGMAHELGHVFRRDLSPAELSLVNKACRVQNGKWDRYSEERWASQFELYLKRGKAPNPELEGVFKKFKDWLGAIYQDMKSAFGAKARIHPNITTVLDKVLGGVERPPTATASPGPTKTIGRVTKPVGQELPVISGAGGPTVGDIPETPDNPVVMRVNKDKNTGVGITRDLVMQRDIQLGKHPITPMAEQVANIPLVKEHIMDPLHEALTAVARGYGEAVKKINEWKTALPPNAGKRIVAYAYSLQPGTEPLLKDLGFDKAPTLTEGEMVAYNSIRADYERLFPLINSAREYLGHNPIGKIENYFTVMRKLPEIVAEGHDLILDPDGHALTERLKQTPEPGFFKKRGAWSDLPLQDDAFHIYEYYVRKALQYIEYAKPAAHSKLLLEDIKYTDTAGKEQVSKVDGKTKQILTDWVNYSTGHELPPWLGRILSDRDIALMRSVHKNLGTGILGGNIRSFSIQPSALYNTYIEFGAKWTIKGAARWMHGGRAEARRLSQHLFGRSFTAEVAEDVGQANAGTRIAKLWKKLGRGSTIGIRWLDSETADLAWNIAYAKATASRADGGMGLSGKKATVFADDATIRGQGSAARMDVSPIQWTPEGRLLTMFQTFPIAQWNMFAKHGLGIKNKDMSTEERARRIFRMAFGAIVVNAFFEGLLDMRSPLPAPEWQLLEGIKKGKSWSAILVDMATEPLESVPLIGGTLRYGTERKSYLPAPIQTAEDLFQLFAKGKRALAERDFSVLQPENLSAPLKVLGVPGVSQAEKMMRRRQQGGTWPQAIIGTKMETLGTGAAGLTKADKALLDKYGVGGGRTGADAKNVKKKNQKEINDLLKKYGVKK